MIMTTPTVQRELHWDLSIMDTVGPLYNGHIGASEISQGFLIMEVKQYTKVLVWAGNKCP